MARLAVTKLSWARPKSGFGEHFATKRQTTCEKDNDCMDDFGSKLLSSFLRLAIYSVLKYLRYTAGLCNMRPAGRMRPATVFAIAENVATARLRTYNLLSFQNFFQTTTKWNKFTTREKFVLVNLALRAYWVVQACATDKHRQAVVTLTLRNSVFDHLVGMIHFLTLRRPFFGSRPTLWETTGLDQLTNRCVKLRRQVFFSAEPWRWLRFRKYTTTFICVDRWFFTFFVSFTLQKNQKIYFTPNNVYCDKAWPSWKRSGEVLLEKSCKLHSDTWIFVLTGTNFRVMLVRNYQSLRWNVNKMLLQASMNTVKMWFAEVTEILNLTSYEPAYHWIKGQNVWKKECHV